MTPGYKLTEVGVIPVEWEARTWGSVATFQRGYDLPHRLRKLGSVPVVTSAGVTDSHAEAKAQRPGVVTGRYGTIGEVFFVDEDYWPHNTTLFVTDFHGNEPLFVAYLLRRVEFSALSGKSGVPGVNRNDLHSLNVGIPPTINEQRAIAQALSDTDALIAALEKLTVKKRDLKQAAMQQLLSGRTRLPGFSGVWQVQRFSELAQPRNERIDPKKDGMQKFCIELEHIESGSGRLFGSTISELNSSVKATFQMGDVLFGKLRAYLRKYWLSVFDGVCSTEIWVLAVNKNLAVSEFVYQLVQTERFIEVASVSYGTHMPRSDWNLVKMLEICVPDIEEQTAIATTLSDMDAEIEALEHRLTKTRALKQGMMQALLTGKTRLV